MKRFLLPLVLSLMFSIAIPLASFAEGNRSVTILFTGSVKGSIDPCRLPEVTNSSGGLARRAHMIESIRKNEPSVLLLDCGAVFDAQQRYGRITFEGNGTDGVRRLKPRKSGVLFWKGIPRAYTFLMSPSPILHQICFIAAAGSPGPGSTSSRRSGGIKVAILGVFNPDDLTKIPIRHW